MRVYKMYLLILDHRIFWMLRLQIPIILEETMMHSIILTATKMVSHQLQDFSTFFI